MIALALNIIAFCIVAGAVLIGLAIVIVILGAIWDSL